MDVREFIKKKVAEGAKQVEIAKRAGISQGTVYKLLYTDTNPTMDTIVKIANGYGLPSSQFIAAEDGPQWDALPVQSLTAKEKQLLKLFRSLNERRQDRALDTLEDMALAFRESRGNEPQEKNLTGSKSTLKSVG